MRRERNWGQWAKDAQDRARRLFVGMGIPFGGGLMALLIASTVSAGGVGLVTTAKTIPPATVAVIDPESGTSSGGGTTDVNVGVGDVILFRFRYMPVPESQVQGINAWITEYIPPNLQVVGVRLMDENDETIPPRLAGLANTGYASSSQSNYDDVPCFGDTCTGGRVSTGEGGLAQVYQDTGVFFSTDPRTARVPSNALITLLNGRTYTNPRGTLNDSNFLAALGVASPFQAHNDWDWAQTEVFGVEGGNPPHLYGSPVAGPDTHFIYEATELGGVAQFRSAVGPWRRVQYPGSQIATGGAATGAGGATGRFGVDASTLGWDLTPNNPLPHVLDGDPASANALRLAVGEAIGGVPVYVEIAFRVMDTPLDPGFGALGGDINCGESFGGDISASLSGADSAHNPWFKFVPSPACVFLNLLFDITSDEIVRSNAAATNDMELTIRTRNLSRNPRTNVWVRQKYNGQRITPDLANPPDLAPTCEIDNCDGDGLDCIFWSLGTLDPSEEVVIHTNFDVSNGGDATTPVRADFTSDDLGTRSGNPCGAGSIDTPGFVTQEQIQTKVIAILGADLVPDAESTSAGSTADLSGVLFVEGTQNLTVQQIWPVLPAGWTVASRAGASTPDLTLASDTIECRTSTGMCSTNTPRFAGYNAAMDAGTSLSLGFRVNVPPGTPDGVYPIDLAVETKQNGYGADKQQYFNDIAWVSVGRVRSDPPALDCPVLSHWTTIPGSTTEADGTVIRVYFNGIERGTDPSSSAGRFEADGWHGPGGTFGSLYGGLEVRATAQAPGENVSELSVPCSVQQVSQCQDELDNDGDGLIDFPADPGCSGPTDGSEGDPECSDGVDNDGDGDFDWPADLECDGPDGETEGGPPACNDGVDNDGDGQIDVADGDCTDAMDRTEVTLRRCMNQLDDDGDGLLDFPEDPGCHSANDDDETDFEYLDDDIRARLLFVFDTSGSMNWHTCADQFTGGDGSAQCAGDDVDCGTCNAAGCGNGIADDSRLFQARAGISDVISGFGEVEYGLMRFHQRPRPFACPTQNASEGSGGWQGAGAAPCGGGFAGGDVLVGFSPENEYDLLEWMDNSTNYPGSQPPAGLDFELRGTGTTPIAGSLTDALEFLDVVKGDDDARTCRPYRVILITDGEETCGGDPVAAAGALSAAEYPTYVIGFATPDPVARGNLDDIAAAGGTTQAIFADDATTLSAAISQIVNDSILIEVCDGIDNDCDTEVDEGFTLYCDRQGGISSPTQCVDPGETVCDGVDDNCDGEIDEGLRNACGVCGPVPEEICNRIDDDCDGPIDEGDVCDGCVVQPEICDGIDNDCDGEVDENLSRGCGTDVGECEPGSQVCTMGSWGTCSGIGPAPEECDNRDNDCDGVIDGITRPCGETDVGVCTFGTETCVAGHWTEICEGGIDPTAESCNLADDDCDGVVDNGNPGGGASCGSDIGECTPGMLTCVGGALVCTGIGGGSAESCNGRDDDCDGSTDEGLPTGAACGQCGEGVETCVGGSYQCRGDRLPTAEICNNFDDDCDDLTDEENPGGGGSCGTDIGECTPGTLVCTGGSLQCTDRGLPTAEECDGEDDDCDGRTDEGIPTGAACGECGEGVLTCVDGGFACRGDRVPSTEICNGLDDDCDDLTDEENPGGGVACGPDTGECVPGLTACVDGALVCQDDVGPAAELCNVLDDDCDGIIDEGNPEGGASCGTSDVGECELGVETCEAGAIVCLGATDASPERCDGLDNDCDGPIDEGDPGAGAACGDDTGECQAGTQRCTGGALVCEGGIGPVEEVCNNLDDDCDGVIDDGLDVGAPCGTDTGECVPGIQICESGAIVCDGAIGPTDESCNILDDDCDGMVDEELPLGGVCGNADGACVPGMLQCISGREICVGEVPAGNEVCDCEDNDCDGTVDEEPDSGSLCPGTSVCLDCSCALPCIDSEFGRCPPGRTPTESEDGCFCVAPRCNPETCAGETVMAGDDVLCAPDLEGTPTCECTMGRCTFPCEGVVCSDPLVCNPFSGECVEDNCRGLGCPGTQICDVTVPECVDDPCESAGCGADEVCRAGTCEASCATVACDDGEVCRSGACVADACATVSCDAGEVCDPSDGSCVTDECGDLMCPSGSTCEPTTGGCVPDLCTFVDCPEGQRCVGGECELEVVPEPDAGTPDPDAGVVPEDDGGVAEFDAGGFDDPEDRILAAGGCSCRSAGAPSEIPAAPWLALFTLTFVLVRRGRKR